MGNAINKLFDDIYGLGLLLPYRIDSDQEKSFAQVLKTQWPGVQHIQSLKGDHRSLAFVDRAVRTLRSLINRYLNAYNTNKWADSLQKLVDNHNTTESSVLGDETPAQAIQDTSTPSTHFRAMQANKENEKKRKSVTRRRQHVSIGSLVRVPVARTTFRKGTLERFKPGVFKVLEVEPNRNRVFVEDEEKPYRRDEVQLIASSANNNPFVEDVGSRTEQRQEQKKQRRVDVGVRRTGIKPHNYRGDPTNSLEYRLMQEASNLPAKRNRKK